MKNNHSNQGWLKSDKFESKTIIIGFGWFLAAIFSTIIQSKELFFLTIISFQGWLFLHVSNCWLKAFLSRSWEKISIENIQSKYSADLDENGSTLLSLPISYSYIFHGKMYNSIRICYPYFPVTGERAYEFEQILNKGAITHVFVNPKNPKDSVLIHKIPLDSYYLAIIYFLGAPFALWLSILSYLGVFNAT